MKNKFYDTSSLLLIADELFQQDEYEDSKIIISSITLKELEHIKTSANKDLHIKYAARKLLKSFNNNLSNFTCIIYKNYMDDYLTRNNLEITNDTRILATAVDFFSTHKDEEFQFITNDIALKMISTIYFPKYLIDSICEDNKDKYRGYLETSMNDEDMADFYLHADKYGQQFKLLTNQYLIIHDKDDKVVDILCWTGESFRPIKYKTFSSQYLGNIKPYKDDVYQAIAADSFIHNKITIIKGPAGAGKSHLALGYLFSLLEHHKIDKIIIFCNTVATKNSAKLGFYPGSKDEKLLDSQIGNFLASKMGGIVGVEQLIDTEKLVLLPMSDIRGYDTSGMNAGIYITEAQNLDVELLKLALQRVGEDSIIILDGDIKSQVDLVDYEGSRNGMRRASQVFRGTEIYGEIELKKIHRSRIAEIANKM